MKIVFLFYCRRRLYSARSVDLGDGAAWELAHKDDQANKDTRTQRATNDKGFYRFLSKINYWET